MIQVHKSEKEIGFKVSGETYQQVTQWTYSIDEMVFKEQLATGLFRNKVELGEDILALMRQVEKQGGILPYYGVGGSSGVCTYCFRIIGPQINLTVEHGATGKSMNLTILLETSEKLGSVEGRRFKFSSIPYLIKEKLPQEWSGEPPEILVCKIAGREYENLMNWSEWVDTQALSERYEYRFSEVSMGATGFVAKVKDMKSEVLIDVTDYADW